MGSGVGYYQRKSGHDSRRSRTSGTGYSGSYLLAVQHEVLMHVISRVKAMLPRCVVALGGPEFLGHNEDFLRTNRFVDCVFRGEGEETFPAMARLLAATEGMDPYHGTLLSGCGRTIP